MRPQLRFQVRSYDRICLSHVSSGFLQDQNTPNNTVIFGTLCSERLFASYWGPVNSQNANIITNLKLIRSRGRPSCIQAMINCLVVLGDAILDLGIDWRNSTHASKRTQSSFINNYHGSRNVSSFTTYLGIVVFSWKDACCHTILYYE